MSSWVCEFGCCVCCCSWGAAISGSYKHSSGEEPEFDCANCPIHGGQQYVHRCKRHKKAVAV